MTISASAETKELTLIVKNNYLFSIYSIIESSSQQRNCVRKFKCCERLFHNLL